MALYSQTSGPVTLLSAATATGTGAVVGFNESASSGAIGQAYSIFTVQVNTTGSPATISVQLQGSLDGVNYTSIGSAIAATGASSVGTANLAYPYIRANLATLTGGTNPTVTVLALGAA